MASVFSNITRDELNAAIERAGVKPTARGETLGIAEFAAIANELI